MIYINFNDSKIPAENDGTPINPPQYWIDEPGQTILNGIAEAFANGHWEPVPEPTPPPPEPNWGDFNKALIQDPGYTAVSNTVASIAPSVLVALNMAMDNLRKGEVSTSDFADYVEIFCQVGQPTTQQRDNWATIADGCSLPNEIIAIIRG